MQTVDLTSVAEWLTDGARSATRVNQFVSEICERLVACGLPLSRVGVFVSMLHPSMIGRNFIWRSGVGVAMGSMAYGSEETDDYLSSPLATVFEQGREVRRRLDGDIGNSPFFAEMREKGAPVLDTEPRVAAEGRAIFLHPKGTNGVLLELLEKA